MNDREHGAIEFWNQTSYGFIRPDRTDTRDIFFTFPSSSCRKADKSSSAIASTT